MNDHSACDAGGALPRKIAPRIYHISGEVYGGYGSREISVLRMSARD